MSKAASHSHPVAFYMLNFEAGNGNAKQRFNMKQITFALLAILAFANASAQSLDNIIPTLNFNIENIGDFNTKEETQGLEVIGKLLQDKKVIALGEATHGTLEHTVFKANIIKYLILNHNLKRIAFESEMAGSDRINQFVLNPADQSNLKDIVKESGMFDVFISDELLELILWIRDYNEDKPDLEKVHFAGMDVQYPALVAKRILNTPKLMSLLNQAEQKSLQGYAELFHKDIFAVVPKELLTRIILVNKKLASGIKNLDNRDSVSIYTQYNSLLSQSIKMRNKSMYLQSYYRDKYMADNTEWIANQTADNQKIVVWAHNGHISKGLLSKHNAMGLWLKRKFSNKYYALALLAGEGSARLYNASDKIKGLSKVELPPLSNSSSLEYLFSRTKYENFIFNVETAGASNDFKEFFKRDLYIRSIGPMLIWPMDIKVNLRKSFDGLVFFRTTNALSPQLSASLSTF